MPILLAGLGVLIASALGALLAGRSARAASPVGVWEAGLRSALGLVPALRWRGSRAEGARREDPSGAQDDSLPGGGRPPGPFRGLPVLDAAKCPDGCRACAEACPTSAIEAGGGAPSLDLGRCLFCNDRVQACPEGALRHTGDHRLAARRREDLILRGGGPRWAGALEREGLSVLGRSLRLRHVGAGGWNGCEVEVNVLDTVVLDLLRFGVRFVASPRHADGILVTGPVTLNMEGAFRKAYDAVPSPKIVVAVGACAVSGGPCAGHPEARDGAAGVVPVDLWVPGCPPHPLTTLDGLLGLPGRLPSGKPPA